MKPELEKRLREGIREADAQRRAKTRDLMSLGAGPFPRDVIQKMVDDGDIDSPKQAWRTLEKWSRRGEYDYGVSLDLGWLEEKKVNP